MSLCAATVQGKKCWLHDATSDLSWLAPCCPPLSMACDTQLSSWMDFTSKQPSAIPRRAMQIAITATAEDSKETQRRLLPSCGHHIDLDRKRPDDELAVPLGANGGFDAVSHDDAVL